MKGFSFLSHSGNLPYHSREKENDIKNCYCQTIGYFRALIQSPDVSLQLFLTVQLLYCNETKEIKQTVLVHSSIII